MPLPLIAGLIPAVAAAAPWIIRMAVKYAWGPLLVGLSGLMRTRMGLFIAGAFAWLGLSMATYNLVIEPTIAILEGLTQDVGTGGASGFGAAAGAYVGIMQMDRAVTMIISAVVTKHALLKGRLFLTKRIVP